MTLNYKISKHARERAQERRGLTDDETRSILNALWSQGRTALPRAIALREEAENTPMQDIPALRAKYGVQLRRPAPAPTPPPVPESEADASLREANLESQMP